MKATDIENTAFALEPLKVRISRFHPKYYLAKISIGLPPKTVILKRKCKKASDAVAYANRFVARIRCKDAEVS